MAESTLTYGYEDLMKRVAYELGYGSQLLATNTSEGAQCDQIVQQGYRMFLVPTTPDGGVYKWSFLRATASLSVVANTTDYDLPDAWGTNVGNPYFVSSAQTAEGIALVTQGALRSVVQNEPTLTGRPAQCAIFPKTFNPTVGQRFFVQFWPKPDASYTVAWRYNVTVEKLTSTNKYHLGGMTHTETVMAGCLAAAELLKNQSLGAHYQNFMQRLQTSIALDKETNRPEYLGNMRDWLTQTGHMRRPERLITNFS